MLPPASLRRKSCFCKSASSTAQMLYSNNPTTNMGHCGRSQAEWTKEWFYFSWLTAFRATTLLGRYVATERVDRNDTLRPYLYPGFSIQTHLAAQQSLTRPIRTQGTKMAHGRSVLDLSSASGTYAHPSAPRTTCELPLYPFTTSAFFTYALLSRKTEKP